VQHGSRLTLIELGFMNGTITSQLKEEEFGEPANLRDMIGQGNIPGVEGMIQAELNTQNCQLVNTGRRK
jgi:hypothetical protein